MTRRLSWLSATRGRLWLSAARISLGAITVITINDNIFEVQSVIGPSMSPTLSPNYEALRSCDLILWSKWQPIANLRRGEIVTYRSPHKAEAMSVKRVIALEGDTVLLDPRRRPADSRNGRANTEAQRWDVWGGKVRVPKGHVWVEGDNAEKTYDSNAYGPISKALIEGRVVGLIWPVRQFLGKPGMRYVESTRVVRGDEDEVSSDIIASYT